MHKWIRIGVVAVLAACGSTEPGPLRLHAAADRVAVSRADSVVLSLQLVNQSARTVSTFGPDTYGFCRHAFLVVDSQGRSVSVQEGLCAAALLVAPSPIELAPGTSITIRDVWYPSQSRLGGQELPVGTYHIVGRVWGDGSDIVSAPIEVSVFSP